jgi:hypothetical protein
MWPCARNLHNCCHCAGTKRSPHIKRPGDPEAKNAVPVVGAVRVAARRAEAVRSAAIGTAADVVAVADARLPWRTIRRCAIVIIVDAILDSLPDVADDVIETELVRCEGANRRRLSIVPLADAADAVGVVLADVVAPRISRRRSSVWLPLQIECVA